MQKLLIVQHEEKTTAGTTLEWAKARGIEVDFWWPATEAPPADLSAYLGLVLCGGSMDAFEEEKFPWLIEEKTFLRNALKQRTRMFGLCLGSQLLADVLGGKVYVNPKGWEIGFVPLDLGATTLPVFHWHHCTFDLPPGAELLAEGSFCRNQAFTVGEHVIATQFHPESTEAWIRDRTTKLKPHHQGLVQSSEQMLSFLPLRKTLQDWYFAELDRLFLGKI